MVWYAAYNHNAAQLGPLMLRGREAVGRQYPDAGASRPSSDPCVIREGVNFVTSAIVEGTEWELMRVC